MGDKKVEITIDDIDNSDEEERQKEGQEKKQQQQQQQQQQEQLEQRQESTNPFSTVMELLSLDLKVSGQKDIPRDNNRDPLAFSFQDKKELVEKLACKEAPDRYDFSFYVSEGDTKPDQAKIRFYNPS